VFMILALAGWVLNKMPAFGYFSVSWIGNDIVFFPLD